MVTSIAIAVAMIVLIPPRGKIDNPQYYAHGPDIPRALDAVEAARKTTGVLDQELNAQLVGLARLVIDPGKRSSLAGQPVITVASDLHNNVFGLGVLERLADRSPVFFVGDLTDRGSPLETSVVVRAVHSGNPFVFVTGNHDSDYLARELAQDGAIVLTRTGRLKANGTHGAIVNKIAGLRVAGYEDPFERLRAQGYADRYDSKPAPYMQDEFTRWLMPLIGKVDVVMVHEPALIAPALAVLKDKPPDHPIVFLVGHTHIAALGAAAGRDGDQRREHRRGRDRQPHRADGDGARALHVHPQADVPAARGRPRLDRPGHRLLVRPPHDPAAPVGSDRWTICWSSTGAWSGIRTGRCRRRARRCRWSRRRACGCSSPTGASWWTGWPRGGARSTATGTRCSTRRSRISSAAWRT